MTTLLDLIKLIISNFYDQELQNQGSVKRGFYEKIELKDETYKKVKTIAPNLNLTIREFDEKYPIAIKEVKFNRQTTIGESFSITKDENDSWLTSDRIKSLQWDDETKPTYRNRYLRYLSHLDRPQEVIFETKKSSLEIVKKIGDPKSESPFFVKGLVVGSVQSGKTSNFNAVINSCVDLGYNLIIVLSGLMEDLRRQTQLRIEKEVEGKMISSNTFIGVGNIQSFGQQGVYQNVIPITIPTSSRRDFSQHLLDAGFSLNQTNILVCKKNTSVLRNLILWLNSYLENGDKHNLPLIIIDDEADNASINNLGHKGKNYANKINGHIRTILAMFNKKTYLGYTATPFANVLQDWNEVPDKLWKVYDPTTRNEIELEQVGNLFPDDFIELLNPPSNYIGPKNFFETKISEIPRLEPLIADPITDYLSYFPERVEILDDGNITGIKKYKSKYEFEEDFLQTKFESYSDYREKTRGTTKDDNFPKELPKSLIEAVYCFIISTAIRLSRKPEMINSKLYQPHNTMLVHISRYTEWQSRTKDLLQKLLESINSRLENDHLEGPTSIYEEFYKIWIKYYSNAMDEIRNNLTYSDEFLTKNTFVEIRELLYSAGRGIEIKAVNTLSNDELDYEAKTPQGKQIEKKYIVIGGNKLSRGFTLEGLTINYFIRNTNYSDTLLQMGRWFGYRPGYIDCCKLFTTSETLEKYNQCTWTIEELEVEFIKLSKSKPHKTPIEYATKVLTHPGTLKITRPSILKNAVVEKWSFEDKLLQTSSFILTKDKIENSWKNFKEWIHENNFDLKSKSGFAVLKTTPEIVFKLLKTQSVYPLDSFELEAIIRYVKLANEHQKLTNWTIAIKTTGESRKFNSAESGLPFDVKLKKISTNATNLKIFKETKVYNAYGKSRNIISGKDLSVSLSDEEIKQAENEYKLEKPNASNYPERIYREIIPDKEAVLIIYLMDLEKIFKEDIEMSTIALNENIDLLSTPLIGFAIGIPPIGPSIGGQYLLNKQILTNIQESQDEILNNENELDDDESEDDELGGINDINEE